MTGWPKHIIKINFIALFLILVFTGCQEKEEEIEEVIVARVGSSVLTENQLEQMTVFSRYKSKFREEIIADWVDSELLLLRAEESGILQDSLFNRMLLESKRKLAGSMFLKNYYSEKSLTEDQEVIEDFFTAHEEEFALSQKAYIYNLVELQIESFFSGAESLTFFGDKSKLIKDEQTDSLNIRRLYRMESEIFPDLVKNALDTLEVNEISIIPNSEPGVVSIVQLIHRFSEGDIPEYQYIKPLVIERYRNYKRMLLYEELMKELYTQYDVIISR